MDSHRITGGLEEVVGAAEEHAAKLTGDHTAEARGTVRRARGKIERQFGATLDSVRDLVRDRPLLAIGAASAAAIVFGASIIGRTSPADTRKPATSKGKR